MKFYSGTEFHCGTPKYSQTINRLLQSGFALFLLSIFFKKIPEWIPGIGVLLILSGLVVLLVGHVAERKEWEAKRKADVNTK